MDREKVIKGLQAHADGCGYRSHHCDAMECPYRYGDESCDIEEMCRDALALLKEQEPRVMTLDELTEIYVEFKGDNCPIRLTNFDLQKIIMYMDDGICRLWTGKPTDEQRQAVKWE